MSTITTKQEYQTERNECLEMENSRLRLALRRVTAIAITQLYDTHPKDVSTEFSNAELQAVVKVTSPLESGAPVEAIYKSAWLLSEDAEQRVTLH